MTTQQPKNRESESQYGPGDDEVDLKLYIDILIKWWREILLLTLIPAIIAGVGALRTRMVRVPIYEAASTVVIAREMSDVTFDERFRTITEVTASGNQTWSVATSRRASLVGLVKSGAVAQSVAHELTDVLEENEQIPAVLLGMIAAESVAGAEANVQSDLIRISATATDPDKAAALANAWARHYVDHANSIYGQTPANVLTSVENELLQAEVNYDLVQSALEGFIANNQVDRLNRLIADKQNIINNLQAGKETAVSTLIEEEMDARREIIAAYIDALAANRLLTFNKEQDANRQLLSQYIDTLVQNRLLAFEKDQAARLNLLNRMLDAQIQSTNAVFDQQRDEQINRLARTYNERFRLEKLLVDLQALQLQNKKAGESAAPTNGLALLLLKSRVFNSQPLQNTVLNLENVVGLQTNAEEQAVDVAALIDVVEKRITELATETHSLSTALLEGGDYQYLDEIAAGLAVSAPLTTTTAMLIDGETTGLSPLSQAIVKRYSALFEVGGLTSISEELSTDSELLADIESLYPELFELGSLAQMAEEVIEDNPLALASLERAQELLQLQGLEDIPTHSVIAEPVSQAIDELESEIQALQAEREAQDALRRRLEQQRDLAWNAFTTLSNKVVELGLESTAVDSVVRLGGPAIPPVKPISSRKLPIMVVLAAAMGFMLAVFLALFATYLGKEPFFARR